MKKKSFFLFFLLLLCAGVSIAQTRVSGKVIDENGDPIIGATIQIKGTGQGTVTDLDGNFTLSAPADGTLVISYVGMKTQEVSVAPNLQIVMQSASELLEEVVVVGYGTQRKENLTGAVSSVDVAKTLNSRPIPDVVEGYKVLRQDYRL
jgi:hypothetical protein